MTECVLGAKRSQHWLVKAKAPIASLSQYATGEGWVQVQGEGT
jgi:hypothetical protein